MTRVYLTTLLLIAALCSAVKLQAQNAPVEELPVQITRAEYGVYSGPGLPDESVTWHAVELPFMSGLSDPDTWARAVDVGYIWLRLNIPHPASPYDLSLLFWRYNLSMRVYFNGIEIASNGSRPNRVTVAWNRPLLANIRDDRWRTGNNEVLVQLYVTPLGGNLAPVLLGPDTTLTSSLERRQFMQVDINRILMAFALTIGLFTLGLWLMRRHDTLYLWFSGICLTWTLGSAQTVIYYLPIPYTTWIPIVHTSIDLCIFFLYGFIGRLADIRKPWAESMLLAWTGLASVLHFTMVPAYFWYSAYLLHVFGIAVLSSIIIRVSLTAVKKRQTEAIVLSCAILGQIALFLINVTQMFLNNGEGWDSTLVYAHFGIPLLLVVFAAALLRRFTQALSMAELLNRELEQKVEISRQIIEKSFEERRRLELKQAAEQERQKIYRDLHDDVGSRLLSIIHANADKKVGDMARATLESLRFAVSRANTPDQPLSHLLADLREESELRLQGSGHQVDWQQPEGLPDPIMASHLAFNLNRILKELVSNIIRHAQSNAVNISITTNGNTLCLTVTDNGCGFNPQHEPGNGLRNIRERAAECGASVHWHSTDKGTQFVLLMPLPDNRTIDDGIPAAVRQSV